MSGPQVLVVTWELYLKGSLTSLSIAYTSLQLCVKLSAIYMYVVFLRMSCIKCIKVDAVCSQLTKKMPELNAVLGFRLPTVGKSTQMDICV